MRKLILLLALAMGAGACEKTMVVANACPGSWARVVDGRGNLLAERIEYGKEKPINLNNYAGRTIELLAAGFELGTNQELGFATESRYVQDAGSPLSPNQINPFVITWFSPGGCPGRR